MASAPNMPFNLNIKVKMDPIEEIIIKYYIIEFHQKMDWYRLKIKQLLNNEQFIDHGGFHLGNDRRAKYYFPTKVYLIFKQLTLKQLLKTKLTFLSKIRLLLLKMLN